MAEKEGKNINTALKGVLGSNDTLIGLVDGNVRQIETDVEGGLMSFDKGVSKSDINVENGVTGFEPIGEVKEGDKRAVSGDNVYDSFLKSLAFSKLQYTGRSKIEFDKKNETIKWDNDLFIFNRAKGNEDASTYIRIRPAVVSFKEKAIEFPAANWFVAYINCGIELINGTGNGAIKNISQSNFLIKAWSEDTSDVRRMDMLPIFYYNKSLNTISSPFLEEISQTKAIELSEEISEERKQWVNKYPNVTNSLRDFFAKYMYSANDTADEKTRIVALGDSLFARTEHTSELGIIPSENPPTLITKNTIAYVWDSLKGNKPLYRRYDSGFITQNTPFELMETNSAWADSGDIYNAVMNSNQDNASISFTIGAEFDYFNFIDRKNRLSPSTEIKVGVTGSNGLLVCRIEGDNDWVEANNFTFSQMNPNNKANLGICNTQFQRRIEFKKVGASVGVERKVTLTNMIPSTTFNYWGIELIPNGKRYTQLINVSRGGYTLNTSAKNLSSCVQTSVFDRKPDLVLFEVPLLNMLASNSDIETNVNSFIDFVYGDRVGFENSLSLKNKSNNWQDFQVLVIIPHHGRGAFNQNSTFKVDTSNYTAESVYNGIKGELFKRNDLKFIDISTAMLSAIDFDPLFNGKYYQALTSSGVDGNGYTNDLLHPNDKGTYIWAKELCPIFWGNSN